MNVFFFVCVKSCEGCYIKSSMSVQTEVSWQRIRFTSNVGPHNNCMCCSHCCEQERHIWNRYCHMAFIQPNVSWVFMTWGIKQTESENCLLLCFCVKNTSQQTVPSFLMNSTQNHQESPIALTKARNMTHLLPSFSRAGLNEYSDKIILCMALLWPVETPCARKMC